MRICWGKNCVRNTQHSELVIKWCDMRNQHHFDFDSHSSSFFSTFISPPRVVVYNIVIMRNSTHNSLGEITHCVEWVESSWVKWRSKERVRERKRGENEKGIFMYTLKKVLPFAVVPFIRHPWRWWSFSMLSFLCSKLSTFYYYKWWSIHLFILMLLSEITIMQSVAWRFFPILVSLLYLCCNEHCCEAFWRDLSTST